MSHMWKVAIFRIAEKHKPERERRRRRGGQTGRTKEGKEKGGGTHVVSEKEKGRGGCDGNWCFK